MNVVDKPEEKCVHCNSVVKFATQHTVCDVCQTPINTAEPHLYFTVNFDDEDNMSDRAYSESYDFCSLKHFVSFLKDWSDKGHPAPLESVRLPFLDSKLFWEFRKLLESINI